MNSFLELLNLIANDFHKENEKSDKTTDSKTSLLEYLDDCLDTYYQELQKYIDKADNNDSNEEKPESENMEIEKPENKVDENPKTEFLDSIDEVPENIKNNVTNCAVEYFDKIIYPMYNFDEKERKNIIETLADFACWIYKNK